MAEMIWNLCLEEKHYKKLEKDGLILSTLDFGKKGYPFLFWVLTCFSSHD